MAAALPPQRIAFALRSITAWHADPEGPVQCPVCPGKNLKIVDQSARPHAEWYALSCAACGLEAVVNVPLPGSSSFSL